MGRTVLLPLLLFLPGAAHAGAWPQEPGAVFLSSKVTYAEGEDLAMSFYGEYGLSKRVTLGARIDGTRDIAGEADVFLRFAFTPERPFQISYEFAVGGDFDGLQDPPVIEEYYTNDIVSYFWNIDEPYETDTSALDDYDPFPRRLSITSALHLGYGIDTSLGPAWIDARFSSRMRPDGFPTRTEFGVTAGVALSDRVSTYTTTRRGTEGSAEWTRITPAWTFGLTERTTLLGEVEFDPEGDADPKISLGTWLRF